MPVPAGIRPVTCVAGSGDCHPSRACRCATGFFYRVAAGRRGWPSAYCRAGCPLAVSSLSRCTKESTATINRLAVEHAWNGYGFRKAGAGLQVGVTGASSVAIVGRVHQARTLDRWAGNVAIRAKDATVAGPGFEQCTAGRIPRRANHTEARLVRATDAALVREFALKIDDNNRRLWPYRYRLLAASCSDSISVIGSSGDSIKPW